MGASWIVNETSTNPHSSSSSIAKWIARMEAWTWSSSPPHATFPREKSNIPGQTTIYWKSLWMEGGGGGNYRCTIFYLRHSSLSIPPLPFPSLLPSAFHSRRVAKHLAVPIRNGNWVDIGNESEEQITGLENDEGRRGASSQRGITAFVPRMAREHFPEETRNTISRWILEPTPLPPPHVLEEDPRSGWSTSVDVRFLLLLEEGREGLLRGRVEASRALNIADSIWMGESLWCASVDSIPGCNEAWTFDKILQFFFFVSLFFFY